MRLKKLIVHGFKSFADRTEFVFDCPITAIVGPNGCGKSNVVDAIKWVLGEQSAKSLRGEAMMDVIFNGCATRKPGGLSEVVLVFDNPKREDGTRVLNLDVDEVAVGRRLFRDGTSEYVVNNNNARLRDIRDLFLDTGVGVDAYSMIEQGKVDLLLQSNPQERRLIFEEAAGISKYKQRKKEAQRKLEKVEQNLLRVNDIVSEVEKRLRGARIQAGRARTYQEYSQRLSELRLSYAVREYHVHAGQLKGLEGRQAESQERLGEAAEMLRVRQESLTEGRHQLQAIGEQRQQTERQLAQARSMLEQVKQRQGFCRQQLEQMAEQLETFSSDRAQTQQRLENVIQALETETHTLAGLTESLNQERTAIERTAQAFKEGQLQLNQLNQQIEQRKAAILDLMRRLAQVNSRLGAIEIERRNLAAQHERLTQRQQAIAADVGGMEEKKAQLSESLQAVLDEISGKQAAMEQKKAQSQNLSKQMAQLTRDLGEAREHRSGLMSRQRVLQDLESRREGVAEGVKAVLKQREQKYPFVRGLLADVLKVDVDHVKVIEAALDGRDQWLLTNDSAAAAAARESLAALDSRVSILCADRVPAIRESYDWNLHPQRIRIAADLVQVEQEDAPLVRHLLGKTIVVDTLEDALVLQKESLGNGYRFVTLAGEIVEADGTLRIGKLGASMGILSRRTELQALARQTADADETIRELQGQVEQGSAQARELEAEMNALRNEIYQSNTQKVELTSQIAQVNDRLHALRREQPLVERELDMLGEQADKLEQENARLAEQAKVMDGQQEGHQKSVEENTSRLQELAVELQKLAEQLTAARVALGQIQEKQLASQQQVQRQTSARTELLQQLERIARSVEAIHARRETVEAELATAQDQEKELAQEQQELAVSLKEITGQLSGLQQQVEELDDQVNEARSAYTEHEKTLHELQLHIGELRVRVESLIQRTQEELQLDLPAKYQEMAGEDGSGYQPAEIDWDAVAAEIKMLRDKIQRLGNVNLDAIGEQDELEGRQKFLADQVADLASAKKQLETLIEEINKASSERFEKTFNAVREQFQGLFRKLFGGGKADVYLETELMDQTPQIGPDGQPLPPQKVDILEAGIEIIARPPGKQPVSITQLSGGEKTMTCVALLLSIFKSKPSPFCVLDEVDAALDEANNARFNLIVQEFVAESQFIVITHSKRTMQIADTLYGVTQQEHGVSKRVAVRFDHVGDDGQITEPAAA
jgi:chromosome segregation protein